ncbi:methyltransferase domain-containing protein [Candidatus Zixiibacteriota bacterium]
MRDKHIVHGFTAVDNQPDPRFWVTVLDKTCRDPFCIAYKTRVKELLDPRPGGVYLDVGAGTGFDARAIINNVPATVMALDLSQTLMAEAISRGLLNCIVGDVVSLPFKNNSFDGCWADRLFQHLAHPHTALDEIIRVTKPGGRIVIVDPDYDTQVMEFPDQELARRVFRFRAEVGLRNGAIAHRMPAMFAARGLTQVQVESMTRIINDPAAADNVMGLRTWARSAMSLDWFTEDEVLRWEELYDEVVAAQRFMWSVTFFITTGIKPE